MPTYNEYRLPNLQIDMKRISIASGADQASYINAGLEVLDDHDHTEGKGTRITPEGFLINDDFNMNGHYIINSGGITFTDRDDNFTSQGWFVKSGNFYIRDGLGNIIQLTEGNDFIGLDEDIIGGDYDESEAIVSYSSATGTYSFKSSVNYWADIKCGKLILHDDTLSPIHSFTLKAPAVITNSYDFIMPSVREECAAFWVVYPSGSSAFLPEGEDAPTEQVVQVLSDGGLEVGSIKLKNLPVGTPYKGLNYGVAGSLTMNNTSAMVIPSGTEAERPVSPPEGIIRGNDDKGVIECFLEGTWKKAISIDVAGLSFSDIVDTDIINPQENDYFLCDGINWYNAPLPSIDWESIESKPTDLTDLSTHSIGEFGDISTAGATEGQVLKLSGGVFSPAEDGGEGALWGNITGDITNQTDLITLLDGYLNKPDSNNLTKDASGLGEQGRIGRLIDVTIDTNTLADDQVLQWLDTTFVNADKVQGTVSPVIAKGEIYVGMVAGATVLPPSTNDDYVLVHKNKVLQWATTENMTGGGGKFIAIVSDSPSSSKSTTVSTSAMYQLNIDMSKYVTGNVTLTGFFNTPVIYNTLEQVAAIGAPTSTNVTVATDSNFFGQVIVTLLPLIEGT